MTAPLCRTCRYWVATLHDQCETCFRADERADREYERRRDLLLAAIEAEEVA